MKDRFSEEEVVATIARLSHSQLVSFIEAEFVRPAQSDEGLVFRRIDIARLELLCDLTQDLDLDETVLGIVVSLIDQLHTVRQERNAMARAIEAMPEEVQTQIIAELCKE